MKQYYDIKKQYMDTILLYRLGDFYEMFFDDALTASKVLEIVLTQRECGLEEKAPMAGIPHHTAKPYISKLIDNGFRVAICEQLEDPAKAKGLVKRGVVRIISPGMNLENDESRSHNYLMSIYLEKSLVGISYIDITTGHIYLSEGRIDKSGPVQTIHDQIAKVNPSEILINTFDDEDLDKYFLSQKSIFISKYKKSNIKPDEVMAFLEKYLSKKSIKDFKKNHLALNSLASLLDYIYTYEKTKLQHFKDPVYVDKNEYMYLDAEARKNLDISRNKYHNNSLIDLLDIAVSPMGSRLIESSVENPLLSKDKIDERLSLVEGFYMHSDLIKLIRGYLDRVYDVERILGRLSYSRANARDLVSLKYSIEPLEAIKSSLLKSEDKSIKILGDRLDTLKDMHDLLDASIVEEPPVTITEGSMIKEGYSKKLDEIRETSIYGRKRLVEYEEEQRQISGIKNLKIIHNKNTGYFLDVTKSNLDKVPLEYHRVQTLTNSERFMTEELKEIENMIFTSTDDTVSLEYDIFNEIKDKITGQASRIQDMAESLAMIDMASSFAMLALENNYIKPEFIEGKTLNIKNARHPMVEQSIGKLNFIPNDIIMEEENLIQIITGPNMSGKSTYLRQLAIIVLMAQIGSFVPADSASLPIVDKIFTRIGSSDNIIRGESTFMVEMKEMAHIINNATERSLLLLDEVGRGTSTYDGISIAWAILEHLSKETKAKTLFATHYQELVVLADRLDNAENYSIRVKEDPSGIVFLYKIEKGSASRSFGIEVAKLSGMAKPIIDRARTILASIEASSSLTVNEEKLDKQLDFYSQQRENLLGQIRAIDINNLSPLDALKELDSIVKNANLLGDSYD